MAVSQYDKENLTQEQQDKIQQVTDAAKGGSMSWEDAHKEAESIRNEAGYSGGRYGDGYFSVGDETGGFGDTPRKTGSGGSSSLSSQPNADISGMRDSLDQWLASAQQQQQQAIDYQVDKNIQDLRRQEEESNEQFQTMRDQVAVDEAKAKDNQALYAEARGDKGGIGAAQYDAIQNAAAQNRLAVNQQQTKVASEVARQITDLRAQGEFEKADNLLQLSQTYLSQLMSLEQWAAQYNLSVAQFNAGLEQWKQEFNASLEQWDKNFGLQLGQMMGTYNGSPTLAGQQWAYEQEQQNKSTLASAGATLLEAGILPSQSQLDAMGMTADQAKSYISALKMTGGSSGGSSGSGSGGSSGGNVVSGNSGPDYDGLFSAAQAAGGSWKNYISSNYKKYGFSSSTDLANQFTLWQTNGGSAPSLNFDQDEGIWTFNGAKYSDPDDLEQAFKNAGLTEGQKAVLRKKMALFGYQSDYLG